MINPKDKRKFLIISISLHVVLIILLVFFSWPTQKEEVVETLQMVNMEAPPAAPAPAPEAAAPKPEPITPITAPKKDEILIPEKKQPKVEKPKPKPPPKVQSKLKDRLKDLMKDEEKTKKETPPKEDLKKNSQQSLEFQDPNPDPAPSNSTNTPG